jgi:phytoene/squalene synthetase
VEDARARLVRGRRLVSLVDAELAATLSLFVKGGLAILDAIAAQGYDTLKARPVVTKGKKLQLLGGALWGKATASLQSSKERDKA